MEPSQEAVMVAQNASGIKACYEGIEGPSQRENFGELWYHLGGENDRPYVDLIQSSIIKSS